MITKMRSKTLSLLTIGILSLVFLISFASAEVDYLNSAGTKITTISQSVQAGQTATVSFKLKEGGYMAFTNMSFNVPLTLTHETHSLASASTVTGMVTSLNQGQTSDLMTLSFTVPTTQTIGAYAGNLILSGKYIDDVSYTIPITLTVTAAPPEEFNFCKWDNGVATNPGRLKVDVKDIQVTGFGDDNEWLPFDEIEVEVEVSNDGNDDVKDISVEWGLYDKVNDEWVIEPDEIDEVDIDEGDEETFTFKFTIDDDMDVDLDQLDDGDNYALYVRATGEVDNSANDDTCDSGLENIDLIIEKDFVIFSDLKTPTQVSCGEEITITGKAWNIGRRDQDDVSMKIFNKELNINQEVEVGNVDSFDSQAVEIKLKVPEKASQKTYTLAFEVYDEDGDIFESDFDNKESRTNAILKVESCEVATKPKATVSADLVSGGKSGKELVVKATVTNTGDKSSSYLINAAGHGSWASLDSIDPESITLAPGKSGEILLTFTVNKGISGDQLFNVEAISDKELVSNQPVSVTIEESKTDLSSIFGDNWYIWLIGALNVILVIIIIIIAVRVARK